MVRGVGLPVDFVEGEGEAQEVLSDAFACGGVCGGDGVAVV